MTKQLTTTRRIAAALAWVLGSAAGWALVTVGLWGQSTLYTYQQVAIALLGYLLFGALAGAATGLGQSIAIRSLGLGDSRTSAWRWLWASVAGYALALPAGLIIFTLMPLLFGWRSGFPLALPWSVPGSLFYTPFPSSLVYVGFLAGLCQWAVLRSLLDRPTRAIRLLWIFGVWLGIGLGLFAGGIVATLLLIGFGVGTSTGLYPALWGIGWGATSGLVSAAVLWILLRPRRDARGLARPRASE